MRESMTPDPTTSPSSDPPSSASGEVEPPNSLIASQAWAHWEKWRPNELAQTAEPQAFFDELSREAQRQIEELAAHLAGPDRPGEPYMEHLGRLRMARFDATAAVMRELVLLPPEPGHPDEESETPSEVGWMLGVATDPDEGWLPVVMTPDHPRWSELDDDPGLSKP